MGRLPLDYGVMDRVRRRMQASSTQASQEEEAEGMTSASSAEVSDRRRGWEAALGAAEEAATGRMGELRAAADRVKEEAASLTRRWEEVGREIVEKLEGYVGQVRERMRQLQEELDSAVQRKQKRLQTQAEDLQRAAVALAAACSAGREALGCAEEGDAARAAMTVERVVSDVAVLVAMSGPLEVQENARVWLEEAGSGLGPVIRGYGRVLSAAATSGRRSTAAGSGLEEAYTGCEAVFVVTAVDYEGRRRTEGGDDVTATIEMEEKGDALDGEGQQGRVTDQGDGTYAVTYQPRCAGRVQVHVRVNGVAIGWSPFRITVVDGVRLRFESPFDTNGVLYYIGTDGGRRAYSNPQVAGDVVVTCSGTSRRSYSASRFVANRHARPVFNPTDDQPNSWMAVDLGACRDLSPDHYCLRHGYGETAYSYVLRHWELQGSVDGAAWETLRRHVNDAAIAGALAETDWAIATAVVGGRFFRHFRVLQTGPNSSGSNHLNCAGIELYGVLRRVQT